MLSDTPTKEARKPQARSRISNGTATVAADGRTIWVRRLRDLIEAHEQDLGGTDNLNQAQRSLVRRAATLSVELERMEATFATAGKISADDLDSYQRASNTLRRHLEVLGLREQDGKRSTLAPILAGAANGEGAIIQQIRDDIDMYGTCVGRKESKYFTARRIAYAVAKAKETGEPISEAVADLAVKLRLADLKDGEPGPDEQEQSDVGDNRDLARAVAMVLADGLQEAEPEPPQAWENVVPIKGGGVL